MVSKSIAKHYAAKWLLSHTAAYAVDSEVVKGLHYALDGDIIYVLKGKDIRSCKLSEAEELVQCCLRQEIVEELITVIDDMREQSRSGRMIVLDKMREEKVES